MDNLPGQKGGGSIIKDIFVWWMKHRKILQHCILFVAHICYFVLVVYVDMAFFAITILLSRTSWSVLCLVLGFKDYHQHHLDIWFMYCITVKDDEQDRGDKTSNLKKHIHLWLKKKWQCCTGCPGMGPGRLAYFPVIYVVVPFWGKRRDILRTLGFSLMHYEGICG